MTKEKNVNEVTVEEEVMEVELEEEAMAEEPAETEVTVDEKPGKAKSFLNKAKAFGKKALPIAGGFIAGAAVTAGAIVVALAKGGDETETLAIEKDDEVVPIDEIIDCEVVDAE